MYKIKKILLAVSCLLLGSDLFGAKAPGWIIDGTSKSYPKSKYFTAVGEATSKTAAELKAIEAIASIFGQSVQSATKSDKRLAQVQVKNGSETAVSTTIDQSILRQVSEDDLIGIEIVEFYNDEKNAKWYVLAAMDKPKTAKIYSDLISNNNATIKELLSQVDKDYSLNSYSKIDFAVKIAQKNEEYIQRLSVLYPNSVEDLVVKEYQPVLLQNKLRDFAQLIPVCINVNSDEDGRIGKAFEKAVSNAGFNTTKGSAERYVINCTVHLNTSDVKGKILCEYVIDANFADTFLGENIIPLSFTGKEGGNTEEQSISRAKIKIAEKINQSFSRAFNEYLQSLSIK